LVENFNIFKSAKTINVLDIPGQGFFKKDIKENIERSKVIIVFVDSSDK